MDYPDDADIYEHGIISAHPLSGLKLLATTRQPIYNGYKPRNRRRGWNFAQRPRNSFR